MLEIQMPMDSLLEGCHSDISGDASETLRTSGVRNLPDHLQDDKTVHLTQGFGKTYSEGDIDGLFHQEMTEDCYTGDEESSDRTSDVEKDTTCSSISEVKLETMCSDLGAVTPEVTTDLPVHGEFLSPLVYNSEMNYGLLVKTEMADDDDEENTEANASEVEAMHTEANKKLSKGCKASCDVCHKMFMNKVSLTRHMRVHKAKAEDGSVVFLQAGAPRYTCTYCGKGFSQWFRFQNHEWTHSSEKPFSCGVCGAGFNHKYSLQCHQKSHSQETPFECTFCDKAFNQKVKLKVHLRTHTGERPYKCSFCDKAFIQRPHLHAHERVHTNEKPYPCKYCPKAFTQLGNLQKHEMIHTGHKPFQCQFCSKSFVTFQHCVDHERTHTGVKPWVCSICGQAFAQNSTLNRHRQIVHTKQKPSIKSWFCGTCSVRFVDEVTFNKHQQVHDASIRSYVPQP